MKWFSSKRQSYNSLNKKWLNGHSMDKRSASNIRALRIMILILTAFLILYFVIITSIGYQPKKIGNNPPPKQLSILDTPPFLPSGSKVARTGSDKSRLVGPDQDSETSFEKNSPRYFRILGLVMLGVLIFTTFGVLRESPTLTMLSSIVCLCAVAQSVSNIMANIQVSSPVFKYLVVSPAAFLGLLGCLLTIYTALIWASEFETPPHVIEEYKWYLYQIRSETTTFTSPPQLQKPRLSGAGLSSGLFMKTHSRGNSSGASADMLDQHDLATSNNSYSSIRNQWIHPVLSLYYHTDLLCTV